MKAKIKKDTVNLMVEISTESYKELLSLLESPSQDGLNEFLENSIHEKYNIINDCKTMFCNMFDRLILESFKREMDGKFIKEMVEFQKKLENFTDAEVEENQLAITEKYTELINRFIMQNN
jgi:Glu-tRNA(Gln) amidotransferase subunit E-like FAD-binding protein